MDKQTTIDLINKISKSTDKDLIYKSLVKLRTNLVHDRKGIEQFYTCKGIKPLVRLISKPYEKILDVSLSILGNCCIIKDCCKQAISYGIVSNVLTILKSIHNDSVQNRACRLLGNLAKVSNENISNLTSGLGIALASVLKDSNNNSTITMALRAVRFLWNEHAFSREFSDTLTNIFKILIINSMYVEGTLTNEEKSLVELDQNECKRVKFMEQYMKFMEQKNSERFDMEMLKKVRPVSNRFQCPTESDKIELISELLKCLQTITSNYCKTFTLNYSNFQNITHLNNCIVFYTRDVSPFRILALKILSNIFHYYPHEEVRKHIVSSDAVTIICELITKELENPLNDTEQLYCIHILSYLVNDSCNRAKIRSSGAFKKLLGIVKQTKSDNELLMILTIIRNFRYDDFSNDLLLRIGLVEILIDRLDADTKDLEEIHVIDKQPQDNKGSFNDQLLKKIKPKIDEKSLTDDKNCVIADKNTKQQIKPINKTKPPYSPSGSSGYSPKNSLIEEIDEENMDDDYSPVCSDIEDDTENNMDSQIDEDIDNQLNEDDIDSIYNRMYKCEEMDQSSEKDDSGTGNMLDNSSDKNKTNNNEVNKKTFETSEKRDTISLVIGILSNVSHRLKMVTNIDLCNSKLLNTLIRTCRVTELNNLSDVENNSTTSILSQIISERNFSLILKDTFIFNIFEMTQPIHYISECSACRILKEKGNYLMSAIATIAETGYGKGEMAHLLLKGEQKIQEHVAISSMYIIRHPTTLYEILIKNNAIYNVFNIVLTTTSHMAKEAVNGITALSSVLNITTKKCDKNQIGSVQYDRERVFITETDQIDEIVTFVIDEETNDSPNINEELMNGNSCNSNSSSSSSSSSSRCSSTITSSSNSEPVRIKFDSNILTKHSEYYNRMLNSNFRESKEKEIRLKNHTVDGVKFYLHSIYEYYKNNSHLHIPSRKLIGAVLETYDLCHVHLLTTLEEQVFHMILFLLNDETVLSIFTFSLENQKEKLTEIAIDYYISAAIDGNIKVKMYRDAENSKYSTQWYHLILNTIVDNIQSLLKG